MLDAIGSTFIGAVLSFGKTNYRLEVPSLVAATVETTLASGVEKNQFERDTDEE
jgi:hypothetical protein